jgi:hypothetical protein
VLERAYFVEGESKSENLLPHDIAIISGISYQAGNLSFHVSYHHAKFEFQTQLICGETKKTNCNWGTLHQFELFGGLNRAKILFRGSNGHNELLRGVKWTFPINI